LKPAPHNHKTTDSVYSPKTRRKASEISPIVAYASTAAAIAAAVEEYATVGEISDALRRVFGEYTESVVL